eukprot:SAG22_NODE_5340_length_1033_cov_1.408994_2_plen_61_part_00
MLLQAFVRTLNGDGHDVPLHHRTSSLEGWQAEKEQTRLLDHYGVPEQYRPAGAGPPPGSR